MYHKLYRLQLVEEVYNHRLPVLRRLLEFVEGYTDGEHLYPCVLDWSRYRSRILGFTPQQLDDLRWRWIIPSPATGADPLPHLPSRTHGATAQITSIGIGAAMIIEDPFFEQRIYVMEEGHAIRLRLGDIELLREAEFPTTLDGVLSVLTPVLSAKTPNLAGAAIHRLKDISALIHSAPADADPQQLLARIRALVLPASPFDPPLTRVVTTERDLIDAALAVAKDTWNFERHEQLAAAIEAWHEARSGYR